MGATSAIAQCMSFILLASSVAEHGLPSTWVSVVAVHELSCPLACRILVLGPGVKPTSRALAGRFIATGPLREVPKISLISWLVHGLQPWADSQGHSTFLGGVSRHLPHQVPFPVYQSLPTWPALKSSCLSVPKRNRSLGGMTLLIVLIWCHTLEVLSLFVSGDQVPPHIPSSHSFILPAHSHTFIQTAVCAACCAAFWNCS